MESVDLPALVTALGQRAASSPLDRLEAALAMSMELQSSADYLVGHFVAEARQAGCSWTEIGEQIGVSKQAARQKFTQQRFIEQKVAPQRFTPQKVTPQLSAGPEHLVEQPRLVACREAARRAGQRAAGHGPAARVAGSQGSAGGGCEPGASRRPLLCRHRAPACRACSRSRIEGQADPYPSGCQHSGNQERA